MAYLLTSGSKGKAKHAAEHHHAKPGISSIPAPSSAPKEEESSEVEKSVAQAVVCSSGLFLIAYTELDHGDRRPTHRRMLRLLRRR